MIIDCCTKDENASEENVGSQCHTCGNQGEPVSRRTVLLMLKPDLLGPASTGVYRFCRSPDCPTVYFEERGTHVFTTNDLRVIVGAKSQTDPIPLCYCFGFDESHLREEFLQTGSTTIPGIISSFICEGLCACEARNPSGGCCLGEVNRAAKRLKMQS
jgi:Zinc binding domain